VEASQNLFKAGRALANREVSLLSEQFEHWRKIFYSDFPLGGFGDLKLILTAAGERLPDLNAALNFLDAQMAERWSLCDLEYRKRAAQSVAGSHSGSSASSGGGQRSSGSSSSQVGRASGPSTSQSSSGANTSGLSCVAQVVTIGGVSVYVLERALKHFSQDASVLSVALQDEYLQSKIKEAADTIVNWTQVTITASNGVKLVMSWDKRMRGICLYHADPPRYNQDEKRRFLY
jgi:hypothetical protein